MLSDVPRALGALVLLSTVAVSAQEAPAPVASPSPTPAPYRVSEDVVVHAVRAEETAPVARTEIARPEIEKRNYGQEIPYLLQSAPAITYTSDTGTSDGYSYFYVRGIPQPRLNMTLDGVPLNEPEDQTIYFVDFGDFASSLESIQIQRGVGTSPVGTASYGGAVSFESLALSEKPQAQAELAAGSFDTFRGSLGAQTGRFGPGLAAYARGTYKDTDGFRDRSGVLQRSVFYGATHQGANSFLKISGFNGHEDTHLAFLAVEQDVLEKDLRVNPMAPEETDAFGENFLQAQWTRAISAGTNLSIQAYRTSAGGAYRLWADDAHSALNEYQLDWRLLGGVATVSHEGARFKANGGVHANDFDSTHARDTVDVGPNYSNQGHKNEMSAFGRASYALGAVELYGDAQLRHASFDFEGDVPIDSVSWTFFNPRLGARWQMRPTLSAFASVGRASREPGRSDMFAGDDNPSVSYDPTAVRPEHVVDVEAGVDYRRPGLRVQANVYAMEFRDEIAQTGELNEIGMPLRRNVDKSHRRGLELDLRWDAAKTLHVFSTANLSANGISDWQQFYDVYGPDGSYVESVSRTLHDVDPLLTPTATLNAGLDWTPLRDVSAGVRGRYVSTSHLDNTGDDAFTTPSHFLLDASASLSLERWVKFGRPRFRIEATNLLNNERVWPTGYSYVFFDRDGAGRDTLDGISYYYPQSTRAVFATFDLRF